MSVPSSRPAPGAAPAAAQRTPDVDASMRLLRDLMESTVDPSYAQAAARRSAGRRPSRAGGAVLLVLAVLAGWGVTRGVGELRRPMPSAAADRAALEQEINRRTRHADAQARRIAELRTQIGAARDAQLTSAGQADLAAKAAQLALLTGETPVTGPGLEVTLDDAASVKDTSGTDPRAAGTTAEDGRVLDRDLQVVVNGLWAAGAEAIAVNGRRLTALSAIRSAGQAILVDFRPLVPPYRVQAVGAPATLSAGFTADQAGSYVQLLRDNYGVPVTITTAPTLTLPAAGTLELRSARAPSSASPPVSPSVSSSSPSSSSPEVSP